MKQVFQDISNGKTFIEEIPTPNIKDNEVLVKSLCSLISPGTERTLIEFGKSNLISKIKKQPDKVNDVLAKMNTDGLFSTLEAVNYKLSQALPIGYSNVGKIIKLGKNVSEFSVGDRIVSNGPHAEIFKVNKNLCALVPEKVSNECASFTVLASIGLQGIRLANPTFGETFLVSGLGLIGLLTCQILKSQGVNILGIDPDNSKCLIAESLGIKTFNLKENSDIAIKWCNQNTSGLGIDGVIITASTSSNEPINLGAKVSRKKGRIVLVGVAGISLQRDLFYKKELTFQVSCSYGPGRYDKQYEEESNDYPIGYVRWTEQRNFQAILNSFSSGSIQTNKFISNSFSIENASEAYKFLIDTPQALGILLTYPEKNIISSNTIKLSNKISRNNPQEAIISVIGTGNYASRFLIPAFKKSKANFHSVASNTGYSPVKLGKKYSFYSATTNSNVIFDNKEINTVLIATRHNSHAELVIKGLKANKNIFVEKPLCLTLPELNYIENLYLDICKSKKNIPLLMVGFNRRFSPHIQDIKKGLRDSSAPKAFIYTINAGFLPKDSWIQDPKVGGGRLIGEACHFIDLIKFLADSKIKKSHLYQINQNQDYVDNFSIQLTFMDGSIGTIHYLANGNKSFPKERLEIFSNGSIIRLDNFKSIKTWGISDIKKRRKTLFQDKGQNKCAELFLNAIKLGKPSPIPFEDIVEVHRITIGLKNNSRLF